MGVLSYALELIRARSEVASRQRALEQQQSISKSLRLALQESEKRATGFQVALELARSRDKDLMERLLEAQQRAESLELEVHDLGAAARSARAEVLDLREDLKGAYEDMDSFKEELVLTRAHRDELALRVEAAEREEASVELIISGAKSALQELKAMLQDWPLDDGLEHSIMTADELAAALGPAHPAVQRALGRINSPKAPPAAQRVEQEPIELLTRGHEKTWIPTEGELRVWEHAYPLITVRDELRRYAAWLQAHPDQAPSLEGMKAAAGRRLMQANRTARPKEGNNG